MNGFDAWCGSSSHVGSHNNGYWGDWLGRATCPGLELLDIVIDESVCKHVLACDDSWVAQVKKGLRTKSSKTSEILVYWQSTTTSTITFTTTCYHFRNVYIVPNLKNQAKLLLVAYTVHP